MKGVPRLPIALISRICSEVRGFIFDTFRAFLDDHAMRMAAALAFYTTFSVTPALLIGMSIAAAVVGSSRAETELTDRIGQIINPEAAEYLFSLLKGLGSQLTSRHLPLIGFASAIVAATAVFAEMQTALNSVWHVTSQSRSGIVAMIRMRLKAFVFVVSIGVLLLASVVTGTVLATVNALFAKTVPIPPSLLGTMEPLIQFGILPFLLASTYKLVPDVDIAWRDVVLAAAVTSFLFLLGKSLFGMYLRLSIVGSVYGAAGSLVIVLAWVYYSAQVFFLGAEMSKVFAQRYGSHAEKARPQPPAPDKEPGCTEP